MNPERRKTLTTLGLGGAVVLAAWYRIGRNETEEQPATVTPGQDYGPGELVYPLATGLVQPQPESIASIKDKLEAKQIGEQFEIVDVDGDVFLVEKTITRGKYKIIELRHQESSFIDETFIVERKIIAVR